MSEATTIPEAELRSHLDLSKLYKWAGALLFTGIGAYVHLTGAYDNSINHAKPLREAANQLEREQPADLTRIASLRAEAEPYDEQAGESAVVGVTFAAAFGFIAVIPNMTIRPLDKKH